MWKLNCSHKAIREFRKKIVLNNKTTLHFHFINWKTGETSK